MRRSPVWESRGCRVGIVAFGVLLALFLAGPAANAALVGWWNFDETAGTTAADLSGGLVPHDATLVNGASFAPLDGRFDGGMWLDGSNQFAEVADHDDLEFLAGDAFTISMWYKRDGVQNDQGLITKGYADNSRNDAGYYMLQTRAGGFTYDSREGPGGNPRARIDHAGVSHGDNQWHHFVVVRDPVASEIRLYVDNSTTPTIHTMGDGNWAAGVHDDPLIIGNHFNRYTQGYFDDISIWKGDALDANDIGMLYQYGTAGMLAASLVWDNAGPGEWADVDAGFSRWRDPADPATQIADIPNGSIHALINGGNAATVNVGAVGTPAVREAFSLTVDGGTLSINDDSTLNVTRSALFGPGTSLSMADGSTLSLGDGGAIPAVTIAGRSTINTARELAVPALGATVAATLVKRGAGTLAMETLTGVAGSGIELDGGAISFTGSFTPGAGPGGEVGAWTFDNLTGTTVNNEVLGGSNGTLLGDATTAPGVAGNALLLDGAGDAVDLGNAPEMNFGTGDFTLSAWINTTHNAGDPPSIISHGGNWDSGGRPGIRYYFSAGEGGDPGDLTMSTDNDSSKVHTVGGPINDGLWHHVAAVREGTGTRVYIDGIESGSNTVPAGYNLDTSQFNAYIGAIDDAREATPTPARFFNGMIDDVKVYDKALAPADIAGLVGGMPVIDLAATHDVTVTNSSAIEATSLESLSFGTLTLHNGILTTISNGAPITFADTVIANGATAVGIDPQTPTTYGGIDGAATDAPFVFSKVGAGDLTVDAGFFSNMGNGTIDAAGGTIDMAGPGAFGGSTTIGLSGGTMTITGAIDPGAGPGDEIGNWTFDNVDAFGFAINEGSGGEAMDGMLAGGTVIEPGLVGDAALFDGVDDAVVLGNNSALNFTDGNWAISAWVKSTNTSGDNRGTIFGNGGDNAGGVRYAMMVGEQASGRVTLLVDDNANTPGSDFNKKQFVGDVLVNDGPWHHVVGLREDGQLRLYVDGVLDDSMNIDASYDLTGIDQHPAFIGAITDNNNGTLYKFFRGHIDEVKLYDHALSTADITDLAGLSDLEMTSHTVEINTDSTLNAASVSSLALGELTINGGILRTTGGPIGFTQTTLAAGLEDAGFNPQTATSLGPIDGSAAPNVTLAKTGNRTLELSAAGTTLAETSTLDVQNGTLAAYGDGADNPLDNAAVRLGGGDLLLSASALPAESLVYDNEVIVDASGTITAGKGTGPVDGPLTVNLGSAASGVTLGPGTTATLASTDGYELNVVGNVTGEGGMNVDGGTVMLSGAVNTFGGASVSSGALSLAGANNIGSVSVSGGTLNFGAADTIDVLNVTGGTASTAGNQVTVEGALNLGGVEFGISDGNTFTVEGTNMVAATNLTLDGGVLTIPGPPVPQNLFIDSFNAVVDGDKPNGIYRHNGNNQKRFRDDGGWNHDVVIPGTVGSWDTDWNRNGGKGGKTSNCVSRPGDLTPTYTLGLIAGYEPAGIVGKEGKATYAKPDNNFNLARELDLADEGAQEYWFSGLIHPIMTDNNRNNFGDFMLNFGPSLSSPQQRVRFGFDGGGNNDATANAFLRIDWNGGNDQDTVADVFAKDVTHLIIGQIDVDRAGDEVVTYYLDPTDVTTAAQVAATAAETLSVSGDFIGADDRIIQFRFQGRGHDHQDGGNRNYDQGIEFDEVRIASGFAGAVRGGFGDPAGDFVPVEQRAANFLVTSNTELAGGAGGTLLGNLTVNNTDTPTTLTLTGGSFSFGDVSTADGVTISGDLVVEGVLSPGNSVGTLNVNGALEFGDAATYLCEFNGAHDQVISTGDSDVYLAGTLDLQVIGVGDTVPNVPSAEVAVGKAYPIVSTAAEGVIVGQFDAVPAVGHLSNGVFNRGIGYVETIPPGQGTFTAVNANLYVASGGDSNADGNIDGQDIQTLIINFNLQGDPPDRDWLKGDTAGGAMGRGDGWVDGQDITDLITNFTGDPGPADPSSMKVEYDETTGEFKVSANNLNSWNFISLGLFRTDIADPVTGVKAISDLPSIPGAFVSENINTVGEASFGARLMGTDLFIGEILADNARPNLAEFTAMIDSGDLKIEFANFDGLAGALTAADIGLPGAGKNITFVPIPEPSTIVMLIGGLAGLLLVWRRRRRA